MEKYRELIDKEDLTREEFLPLWKQFKQDLNTGKIRVAEKIEGQWKVNKWVKQFILLGFKYGKICEIYEGAIDKDTLGERKITLSEGVRKTANTVTIRDGIYIGKGVAFMPPCYTNIGAYIDEGSMIDSLALVGSCAQIRKKCTYRSRSNNWWSIRANWSISSNN